MLRRQKVEPVLRAVHEAFAEKLARADGDLRLNNVIAGAERIAIGIEKRQDAVTLVGFKKLPSDRQEMPSPAPTR